MLYEEQTQNWAPYHMASVTEQLESYKKKYDDNFSKSEENEESKTNSEF